MYLRGHHARLPERGQRCASLDRRRTRPRSRCTPIPTKLEASDGKYRGMPDLDLTEDQIDVLVAYLLERN